MKRREFLRAITVGIAGFVMPYGTKTSRNTVLAASQEQAERVLCTNMHHRFIIDAPVETLISSTAIIPVRCDECGAAIYYAVPQHWADGNHDMDWNEETNTLTFYERRPRASLMELGIPESH